jgi:hypothetical protein
MILESVNVSFYITYLFLVLDITIYNNSITLRIEDRKYLEPPSIWGRIHSLLQDNHRFALLTLHGLLIIYMYSTYA